MAPFLDEEPVTDPQPLLETWDHSAPTNDGFGEEPLSQEPLTQMARTPSSLDFLQRARDEGTLAGSFLEPIATPQRHSWRRLVLGGLILIALGLGLDAALSRSEPASASEAAAAGR